MKVSYSSVFNQTADQVWGVIRDFNSYPVWVATVTESHIEGGKSGDSVGAIRNFVESGTRIRQRLLAHSDLDRSYVYESCGALGAITYYLGTARVASYYRKLWIRCGDERGGVPFRVDHANPGGSRVEGDATDAEGNGKRGIKGSRPGVV